MKMKKLAIASAIALMSMGAAQAATPLEAELGTLLSGLVGGTTTVTVAPVAAVGEVGEPGYIAAVPGYTTEIVSTPVDISALSGAVNTAAIAGNIDISGANVSLSSMAAEVSAKAEAIGDTSTATAYAIAGAKLSTTVIGAMNSATVDVMGRTTDLSSSVTSSLGVASLAGEGDFGMTGPTIAAVGTLTAALTGSDILDAAATTSMDLDGLTSSVALLGSSAINDLQNMNVFNTAINVAELDASIKIAATVDTGAWFLNPQTGVVNLSNIEMSTTAIGAMNSSLTRLGVNLAN
jgi:hypothetical protein